MPRKRTVSPNHRIDEKQYCPVPRIQLTPRRHPVLLYGLLVVLTVAAFLAVPSMAMTDVSTGECVADWRSSPMQLADYLWKYRDDMIQLWPNLAGYGVKDSSGIRTMIQQDTERAMQLSQQYGFGISTGENVVYTHGVTFKSYGDLWTPTDYGLVAETMMWRGQSIKQIYDCFTNKLGFDEDFTATALNIAHIAAANYSYCAFFRTHQDPNTGETYNHNCLDPNIYGSQFEYGSTGTVGTGLSTRVLSTFVVVFQGPSWILGQDGAIYMGQFPNPPSECLPNAVQSNTTNIPATDELGINQKTPWDYLYNKCITIDKLLGGGLDAVIIPEQVAKDFTKNDLTTLSGFYTIINYGIRPTIADTGPNPAHQFLPEDWTRMQSIYRRVMDELKQYSQQIGGGYDFTTLVKVPYDSTLPDSARKKIIWQSFPDPIQDEMQQFADPNRCTYQMLDTVGSDSSQGQCIDRNLLNRNYATRLYEYQKFSAVFSYQQRNDYFNAYISKACPSCDLTQIPRVLNLRTQYKDAIQEFLNASSSHAGSQAPAYVLDSTTADTTTPASPTVSWIQNIVQANNATNLAILDGKLISSSVLEPSNDTIQSPSLTAPYSYTVPNGEMQQALQRNQQFTKNPFDVQLMGFNALGVAAIWFVTQHHRTRNEPYPLPYSNFEEGLRKLSQWQMDEQ